MDIRVSIIAKNKYTQSFIQILSYQIVSDVSTTITGASAHIIYLLCAVNPLEIENSFQHIRMDLYSPLVSQVLVFARRVDSSRVQTRMRQRFSGFNATGLV